jgi:hypothetical protein
MDESDERVWKANLVLKKGRGNGRPKGRVTWANREL